MPPPEGPGRDRRERLPTTEQICFPFLAHAIVAKHGIGLVPEGRHIFGNLTVLENLKLATYARKDADQIAEDYERVFALSRALPTADISVGTR